MLYMIDGNVNTLDFLYTGEQVMASDLVDETRTDPLAIENFDSASTNYVACWISVELKLISLCTPDLSTITKLSLRTADDLVDKTRKDSYKVIYPDDDTVP